MEQVFVFLDKPSQIFYDSSIFPALWLILVLLLQMFFVLCSCHHRGWDHLRLLFLVILLIMRRWVFFFIVYGKHVLVTVGRGRQEVPRKVH